MKYAGYIIEQGKEYRPSLHLSVVAIEKGVYWSPSTMVTNYIIGMAKYIVHMLSRIWKSVKRCGKIPLGQLCLSDSIWTQDQSETMVWILIQVSIMWLNNYRC